MGKIKTTAFFFCTTFVLAIALQSCGSLNKAEKGAVLGSAAGGAIGALIGKRAGNSAIGATIGAALGGSTGAFLGSKLDRLPDANGKRLKPLYVLNGTLYKVKDAQIKLNTLKPEEIESVKVLSNNEAIALYGNKGENGAILITFKSNREI